jgi:hypothetical protein
VFGLVIRTDCHSGRPALRGSRITSSPTNDQTRDCRKKKIVGSLEAPHNVYAALRLLPVLEDFVLASSLAFPFAANSCFTLSNRVGVHLINRGGLAQSIRSVAPPCTLTSTSRRESAKQAGFARHQGMEIRLATISIDIRRLSTTIWLWIG